MKHIAFALSAALLAFSLSAAPSKADQLTKNQLTNPNATSIIIVGGTPQTNPTTPKLVNGQIGAKPLYGALNPQPLPPRTVGVQQQ